MLPRFLVGIVANFYNPAHHQTLLTGQLQVTLKFVNSSIKVVLCLAYFYVSPSMYNFGYGIDIHPMADTWVGDHPPQYFRGQWSFVLKQWEM